MSWTTIFELFQIIVEYTMIDAKVTSKLCFNWLLLLIFFFFFLKVNFFKVSVSQNILIVIASSIVSTSSSYFWISSMPFLFKANWGSNSSNSSGSEPEYNRLLFLDILEMKDEDKNKQTNKQTETDCNELNWES